ncbi:hypothetical protein [Ligilactobacillus salivarius]|uniref:Uncharacterized protein n=1 Tax=Ligilactobacillus salivarius TaxID=1624 RepID=A0A1D7TUE6_9LACO|nr:hypothetical protein [Ligilactobacillus salivarius]AOO74592.1 hypothetical protein BHF65_09975 [Ligilactobacillus salivarius]UDE98323.1 hypothetical protein LG631_09650 [Ligilactobacillus salivarius]UTX37649.1 hypothetical protein NNL28_09370 [Ligilactobacillus salivarius]UUV97434.1 hypothetical protein M3M92_09695 [Ligilactobacillus salivarius]
MSMVENKKAKNALENLLDRQTYLVTQANELARAFGNLNATQDKKKLVFNSFQIPKLGGIK